MRSILEASLHIVIGDTTSVHSTSDSIYTLLGYTSAEFISGTNSFGRKVIAEGGKSTEHGLMLLLIGCHNAQGYGIAQPIPADEVKPWLSHYKKNQRWLDKGNKIQTTKEKKFISVNVRAMAQ